MRALATLIVLALFTTGIAQPVIDTNWIPRPGDNFILQGASYNQLPFNIYGDTGLGLAGSNITWDFSQLQWQNTYDTVSFSGTTHSLIRTDVNGSIDLYWNGDALYSTMIGTYYQFPLDSTYIVTWGDNTSQFSNEVQYLGWGKLLLPGNVHYDNVLLIEQSNNAEYLDYYSDDDVVNCPVSISQGGTDSYQWIVSDISNPILTVYVQWNSATNYNWSGEPCQSEMNIATSSDTATIVWVYQSEFITGVQTITINDHFELFPNPANEQIHLITSRSDATTIYIYNALGELVQQQKFSQTINIGELASGYYILSLQFPEGRVIKQFVKL